MVSIAELGQDEKIDQLIQIRHQLKTKLLIYSAGGDNTYYVICGNQ